MKCNPCMFCKSSEHLVIEMVLMVNILVPKTLRHKQFDKNDPTYFVSCENCGATGPVTFFESTTISGWNGAMDELCIKKLKAIYNDERNATLSWFWDGGFKASYGDDTNGIKASMTFSTIEAAIDFLWEHHMKYMAEYKPQI